MSDKIKAIEFRAEVRAIKTMADGTINITLNLPEDCKEQGKKFIDWHGQMVRVVAEVETI